MTTTKTDMIETVRVYKARAKTLSLGNKYKKIEAKMYDDMARELERWIDKV